jgi:hypothetical protein
MWFGVHKDKGHVYKTCNSNHLEVRNSLSSMEFFFFLDLTHIYRVTCQDDP